MASKPEQVRERMVAVFHLPDALLVTGPRFFVRECP
jgi:hypothetical protein